MVGFTCFSLPGFYDEDIGLEFGDREDHYNCSAEVVSYIEYS